MAMRKLICAAVGLSLVLAAGGTPCRADTAARAASAPAGERPVAQPVFCFRGAAPDRQEMRRYADRTQRDASRTSGVKAGDRDDTIFVVGVAVVVAAVIVGGAYLAAQGI